MNRIVRGIAAFTAILVFAGCQSGKQAAVSFSVPGTERQLPYYIRKDDGTSLETAAAQLIRQTGADSLPYLKTGAAVRVTFPGDIPSGVTVSDDIINEDGIRKYRGTALETALEPAAEVEYPIAAHPGAALSSNSADYGEGRVLRVLSFACRWGDREEEYAVVIRTDSE